jgi:hypothetical protein
MSDIKSPVTEINCNQSKIFTFISDFNNFEKLMPEQVSEWKSDTDSCSFHVQGMSTLALRITGREPESKVVIVPEAGTKIPFTFELICLLNKLDESRTTAEFVFNHKMPAMISMMAGRPLQNLVNIFAQKLKEYCERPEF